MKSSWHKKKLSVITTNNLLNLKSNTMKNTMQNYEKHVIQHNFATTLSINLTVFNL